MKVYSYKILSIIQKGAHKKQHMLFISNGKLELAYIGNDTIDSRLDRRHAHAQISIQSISFKAVSCFRFHCSNCGEARFAKVSGSEWQEKHNSTLRQ